MPFVAKGTSFVRRRAPVFMMRPRGMGAGYIQDPCDCYYPLPGVPTSQTNPNNLPQCDPATGLAPSCGGVDKPPCEGIAFGQPGYAECIARETSASNPAQAEIIANSAAMGINYNPAALAAPILAAARAAAPATTPAPTPTVGQSNAPNAATVGSKAPAQSNAPNPATQTSVPATKATCFGLFPSEPCLGPVGLYTLLASAGVLFFMSMGGKR